MTLIEKKDPVMVNAVFHTKKNGVQATGRYSQGTGRFTVLSGSEVDLVHPVIKTGSRGSSAASFRNADGQGDSC